MFYLENKAEEDMLRFGIMPKKSVLVALSGGADSVALLSALCELSKKHGFRVYAAHVNHCLRGDEAERDEAFAKTLAEDFGVTFFSKRADIRRLAAEEKISEELAGRRVRYEFFEELMAREDILCTATAHHKGDNAETMLMNFMRGSGVGGLCGIPAQRGRIIRPLIGCSRSEIEEYCRERGLAFVTDATNFENEYTRNRVRNSLIGQIERDFNPNITDTLFANSRIISDENDLLEELSDSAFDRIVEGETADIAELSKLHIALKRRVIRRMLAETCGLADIGAGAVENILELCKKGKTGSLVSVSGDVSAFVRYGKLVVGKVAAPTPDFEYVIKVGESVYIKEIDRTFSVAAATGENSGRGECFSLPDGVCEVVISNRRRGDVFCPTGMSGTKKVKDYMIDAKIPRDVRDSVPILRIGGKIAWIVGFRRDRRFFGKNIMVF